MPEDMTAEYWIEAACEVAVHEPDAQAEASADALISIASSLAKSAAALCNPPHVVELAEVNRG